MSKKKSHARQHDLFGEKEPETGIHDTKISLSLKKEEYSNIKWPKSGFFDGECFIKYDLPEHAPIWKKTRLSEILNSDVDDEFMLSVKACSGILLRAKKRKKNMSPMLEKIIKSYMEGRTK